jgi:hypothetical protein
MENAIMKFFLSIFTLTLLASCTYEGDGFKMAEYKEVNPFASDLSQVRFAYDSLHGLSTDTLATNALPYKLTATAILMRRSARQNKKLQITDYNNILKEFGFFIPGEISNWNSNTPKLKLDRPIGLIRGMVNIKALKQEVEVVNMSCSSCHGGMMHDKNGNPTGNMWLGLPNSSLNVEAYVSEVYESIKYITKRKKEFLKSLKEYFPNISKKEYFAMKTSIFMTAKSSIKKLKHIDRATPFANGSPGNTNGVASLKNQLDLLKIKKFYNNEVGYTNIPDLSNRAMRSSLLYDGLYAPVGDQQYTEITREEAQLRDLTGLAEVAAHFTVPVLGVKTNTIPKSISNVEEIFNGFLANYKSPKFPGNINEIKANRGRVIFKNNCTNCHGAYDNSIKNPKLLSFPNKLVNVEEIGTDPNRLTIIDREFIKSFNKSDMSDYIQLSQDRGYVAQILTGLWATSPYLHNGSIPTLWQFLNPELRPTKFEVGGHKLDMEDIGIAGRLSNKVYKYENSYKPWSRSFIFDTTKKGFSNKGHEKEVSNLSIAEKRDLLEYLKLL